MKPYKIAIDGFSSTGKSTVARQLANELGYVYVDSGAMYRAVTLFAIRNHYISEEVFDAEGLIARLPDIKLDFKFNPELGFSEMFLNGDNVERDIRSMDVSKFVSPIARISEIRRLLVTYQREISRNQGVVMDGRDIGTVVFPDADLKFFFTASPEIRARRRYDELIGRGEKVSFAEVLKNVSERDHIDSNREDSPLKRAEDAIEFDNSDLSLDDQIETVLQLVRQSLKDC